MKRLSFISSLVLTALLLSACSDALLNTSPLDQPSDQTFFSNGAELQMAVNAAYRHLQFQISTVPVDMGVDAASDIAWVRQDWSGLQTIGKGAADSQTSYFFQLWRNYYQGIARTNNLLQNMDRAKANTDAALYSRVEGEARFLRAFFYHKLIEYFGDVPLITKVQTLEDTQMARTPKAEVVDFILKELDTAASLLPATYGNADKGRATKGAALALKARVALYNKKYDVAAAAAKQVMDSNVYSLHPDYAGLFTYAGENSPEVILKYAYLEGVETHQASQYGFTRMTAGWSVLIPQQGLVDSYEAIDGLTIDKSPLYDPANPFKNCDPRLAATIVTPGSQFGPYRFETHPDSNKAWNYTTKTYVANTDVTNAYASFSGYNLRKWMDTADLTRIKASELDFILIRLAEVLLTYAEAKIEQGQIDQSVYDAINKVRTRAGMPAISTGKSQAELRQIVRRERKVELAFEGLRLFDLRRWGIADQALNQPVMGRPKREYKAAYVPVFDANGIPHYDAYADALRKVEDRTYVAARGNLWPIPQEEIDINLLVSQNPGY